MLARLPGALRQSLPGLRAFSTSQAALADVASSTKEFTDEFAKVAPPNFNPPSYPSDFFEKQEPKEETQGVPSKVTLNFYMPHDSHMRSEEVSPSMPTLLPLDSAQHFMHAHEEQSHLLDTPSIPPSDDHGLLYTWSGFKPMGLGFRSKP